MNFIESNFLLKSEIEVFEKIRTNEIEIGKWLLKNLDNGLNKTGTFGSNPKYCNIRMSFVNGKLRNEFEYIRLEVDGKDFKYIYDFKELFNVLFFNKKKLPDELEKWKCQNSVI